MFISLISSPLLGMPVLVLELEVLEPMFIPAMDMLIEDAVLLPMSDIDILIEDEDSATVEVGMSILELILIPDIDADMVL